MIYNFEQFNEEKLSKFDKFLIATSLVLFISNKLHIPEKVAEIRLNHKLEILDKTSRITFKQGDDIKKYISDKINSNTNIINKAEIINRLDNIHFIESDKNSILYRDDAFAEYYYHEKKNIDYIIVFNVEQTKKNTIIHEIWHLVHQHVKYKTPFDKSLININISKDEYISRLLVLGVRSELASDIWEEFEKKKEYFTDENEFLSFVEELKFFSGKDKLSEIDNDLMKDIVMFSLNKETIDTSPSTINIVLIIPCINMGRIGEIDLYVDNISKTSKESSSGSV